MAKNAHSGAEKPVDRPGDHGLNRNSNSHLGHGATSRRPIDDGDSDVWEGDREADGDEDSDVAVQPPRDSTT